MVTVLTMTQLTVTMFAVCADCAEGLYGKQCEKRCSPGCDGGCHRITGRCLHGCGPGWSGDNCIKRN